MGGCGTRHTSSLPRRAAPEMCTKSLSLSEWRAQGKPGARCTRSLACESDKAHERSHHRFTGFTRPCLRNGFNGYFVLSPGHRAFLPPSLARENFRRNLTPASGRQDHTTSPSASSVARLAPLKRPSHPAPNVRDDAYAPLRGHDTSEIKSLIWGERQAIDQKSDTAKCDID